MNRLGKSNCSSNINNLNKMFYNMNIELRYLRPLLLLKSDFGALARLNIRNKQLSR